ncbi:MAG: SUMF1/EgtB/PvdO family nonheme iron enzyme [Thermodesulfobacteriota bacterium]
MNASTLKRTGDRSLMKCTKCNQEIQSGWNACPACGQKIAKKHICQGCGKELDLSFQFCPFCGKAASAQGAANGKSLLPDFLEPIADATYARLGGLNAGSEAAQKRQKEWVEKGYPLEIRLKETGIVLRLVPPGEFLMGSSDDPEAQADEKPQHKVTIASPLYVAKFPVTQQQWQVVMGQNPSAFQEGDTDNNPVESVSWDDCQAYLSRLNNLYDLLGLGSSKVRLPTEAEWEYACRAGAVASRYGKLDDIGWFEDNSGETTHPVGEKKANAWGLHDMIGNVWEWCEDPWHEDYKGAPQDGSVWTAWAYVGAARVLRGGSWNSSGRNCRSAYRGRSRPGNRDVSSGFRVVLDLK